MEQHRRGILSALSTYILWGILPLYWNLLGSVSADAILAHRICWSFVFMIVLLLLSRRWHKFLADCRALWADRQRALLLLGAAVMISINWLTYIWAVNSGHVIDTSIGYYINPLVNVLFGVVFFAERLTPAVKISTALAFTGVALMTWELGTLPWVAVVLALSFAVYGAMKKKLALTPFSSITLETMLMLPIALPYLVWVETSPAAHFGAGDASITLFLLGTGIATSVPLILFSYGANLLPLNVLGLLQYISPTIALLLGVFFFHEPFGTAQLIACSFIGLSLVIFTLSQRTHHPS